MSMIDKMIDQAMTKQQRYEARHRALGKCTRCSAKRSKRSVNYCPSCLAKHAERQRELRAKARRKEVIIN